MSWLRYIVLSIVLGAVACSPASREEPPTEATADAPPSAEAIASLLGARHVEDLPDEATLARHEDPAAALRWIASHDGRMVIRARALSSLRFYDDDATRAHLLEVLRSDDAHPVLEAAAAEGTARLTLDDELRQALASARAGGDPRVERAVDARLAPPEPVLEEEPDTTER
jgi:hypothetical protein